MNVLVIGGTRFFGKRIVQKFLTRGVSVTIFTRSHARPDFWGQIEPILADRANYAEFRARLVGRRFDAVVDNIAYNRADVEAAIETFAGNIGHYLLCSTGAVYRDYSDWRQYCPVYEDEADLAYTGDFTYADGKRAAELALRSLPASQRPFPFTILRPTVVEGPEDPSGRTWFWVQRIADGHDVLTPQTRPSSIFRHVYADDVAEAFVCAAGNPAAFNRTYNLAGEEILSLDDYVRAIATAAGRQARIVAASMEWIRLQEGLSNFEAPFVGERFILDIGRAKQDLGYQPTSLGEWLRVTVDWFMNTYQGPGSARYSRRAAEVAAAQRWPVAPDADLRPNLHKETYRKNKTHFFLRATSRLLGYCGWGTRRP